MSVELLIFALPVLSVNGVVLAECDAVCIEMAFLCKAIAAVSSTPLALFVGSIPKVRGGKKEDHL